MNCKNCGAPVGAGTKFCENCGTPVESGGYIYGSGPNNNNRGGWTPPQNQGGYTPPPPPPQSQGGWTPPAPPPQKAVDNSPAGCLMNALCFFFPVLGLILFLVWREDRPLAAKGVGKSAIAGVVVEVVLGILVGILVPIILAAAYGGYYF